MTLLVRDIKLRNFRNYSSFSLSDISSLTIFSGPNAIGKTNIIEALQLTTALTTFKNANSQQLIRWGEDTGQVRTHLSDGSRDLVIKMDLNQEKKVFCLNDKKKRTKDIRGLLPSVLFSPDDLALIKGSQSLKRSSIDAIGIQLSANYQVIKRDYEKILLQKNSLLKEESSNEMLESVNETLITIGTQLFCYRSALFNRIIPLMKANYNEIVHRSEELEMAYIPSWCVADINLNNLVENQVYTKEEVTSLFREELQKRKKEEIGRKRSLVGPHADRIEFYINRKNAGIYGSQGQQRSLVLSFKIAEVGVIQDVIHQKPVLLLDDVMSELDKDRRAALIGFIKDDIQTFITTTHLDYFSSNIIKQAKVIELSNNEGF